MCGWALENAARRRGAQRIAGLDEAGRGPMFGPVVAAAVILKKGWRLQGLTDSKQLTEKQRNEFDAAIRAEAMAWAIAAVDAETIDRINIRRASLLAMRMAVEQLAVASDFLLPDYLLIDGLDTIDWRWSSRQRWWATPERFDCGGERAGEGASRRSAGGAGCGVPRLWIGAAQGLLRNGTPGGAEAAGTDAAAQEDWSPVAQRMLFD